MNKSMIQRMLTLLTLLLGAMSAASAADRFYIDAVDIEAGETKQLAFMLDNSLEYFGFQADVILPEGLTFVQNNGETDLKLSSRADASFNIVSKSLSNGNLRVEASSISHTAIAGKNGPLLYATVQASDDFIGGNLAIRNIMFKNANDNNVKLPDFTIELGIKQKNRFYIPNFNIAVWETKTISIVLDNEIPFTAFQTDVYLPEGLNIVANSIKLTTRGSSNHTVSAKSFTGGRTRIACLSLSNDVFTGNNGALLDFDVTATKDIAEIAVINMKNQIFSMANAQEYVIPNSQTSVTTERTLIESISLDQSSITMVVGDSKVVTASVLPASASTKDVEWNSANPAIATVSQSGQITAVGIGKTTITATAVDGSGIATTCEVSVNGIPVTNIMLNRTSATLKATESIALTATVSPANASDKSLKWESSDTAIASVGADGIITAHLVGEAVISATSVSNPSVNASCSISVIPTLVSKIVINQPYTQLGIGETCSLKASVYPESATDKSIVWVSNNASIASVDGNGLVKAISSGTTRIKATAVDGSGVIATATVDVYSTPAESIIIEAPGTTELKVGETMLLTASIFPQTTSDKTVIWSSSAPSVATVDENGLVSAIKVGKTTITAKCGDAIAECQISVEATPATAVILSMTEATLKTMDKLQLTATVEPETTTDKNVVWSSSNPSIATVDKNGLVSAIKVGKTLITARCGEVAATCEVTVDVTYNLIWDQTFHCALGEKVELTATVDAPVEISYRCIKPNGGFRNAEITEENGRYYVTFPETGAYILEAYLKTDAGISIEKRFNVVESHDGLFYIDGIYYRYIDDSRSAFKVVSGYEMYSGDYVIPSVANGIPVKEIGHQAFYSCMELGKVVIEEGIETLRYESFGNCTLSEISIPASVYFIEDYAFNVLRGILNDIYLASATPIKVNENIFNVFNNYDICILHVPAESVDKYRQAAVWKNFYNIEPTVVVTPASAVILSSTEATIRIMDKLQLTATVEPETTTDKNVVWTSSDASVATVNGNGMVTALKIGKTTITAKCGNASAVCQITVEAIPASAVILSMTEATLRIKDKLQLSATVEPETASDKTVFWSSSDSSIATVDENGLVTAIKVGKATITAKCGEATDTCQITVVETPASSITLNITELTLCLMDKVMLTATVEPETTTDKNVVWTSSDASVATVNENGMVTAIKIGRTTITAKCGEATATCEIVVVPIPVLAVVLNKSEATMEVTETLQLTATIEPETATDKTIVWTSSDPSVVQVDENGLVTAINGGKAIITAKCGEITATCEITVEVTANLIWDQTFHCALGEKVELTATVDAPVEISYRCIKPNGGFRNAEITEENGRYYVTFPETGAYILEACLKTDAGISIEKRFNVVESHDGLFYIDGIYYRYIDDSRSAFKVVSGYEMYSGDYVIPSVANGIPVKEIGHQAFYSCMELGKVVIEEGIETLRYESFGNCTLSEISIPASVNFIEDYAFNALRGILSHIYLASVTPINVKENIFNYFNNYDTCILHVPAGAVEKYRQAAVWKNFYNIEITYNLIWDQTFHCALGEKVELSATINAPVEISYRCIKPNGGFRNAEITEENGRYYVTFPETGAYILEAYLKTDAGISIEKRFNVVESHDGLFYIDGIYYRYIDDSRSAFKVVSGYEMYSGDYVIPTVANGIPVKEIGHQAFYSCMELGKVVIEEGIETLRYESFGNCTLSEISIPASVNFIEDYAFNALRGILSHIYLASVTPINVKENIFNDFNNYDTCTLHVPAEAVEKYRQAAVWKNFYNIESSVGDIMMGDLDRNGYITIGDVTLAISVTILERDPDGYLELGDINGDGEISISDVTSIIAFALSEKNSPYVESAPSFTKLNVMECGMGVESAENITAFQMDINIPGDAEISLPNTLAKTHIIASRRIAPDKIRVIVASMQNKPLPTDGSTILYIRRDCVNGIGNLIFATPQGMEFTVSSATDIDEFGINTINAYVINGSLVIESGKGCQATVCSIGGIQSQFQLEQGINVIELPKGIYIVKSGKYTKKVILK